MSEKRPISPPIFDERILKLTETQLHALEASLPGHAIGSASPRWSNRSSRVQSPCLKMQGHVYEFHGPMYSYKEGDVSRLSGRSRGSMSPDLMEARHRDLVTKMTHRYPTEYAAARLTDIKQVKTLLERMFTENDLCYTCLPEETANEMISLYLAQVGAAVSRSAPAAERRMLPSCATTLEDSIMEKSSQGSCSVDLHVSRHRVHRLRTRTKPKAEASVPSHVTKPLQRPCREKDDKQENLAMLLRSGIARLRRDKSSEGRELERQRDLMQRLERANLMSRRHRLEQSLIDRAEHARALWDSGGILDARADVKVVIVGAGLAGLSAASELFSQGFRNIIILEASNRVGGRLHTVRMDDQRGSPKGVGRCTAELGAPAWVSEDPTDVVHSLATELGLLNWSTEFKSPKCRVMMPDGRLLDDSFVSTALRFCSNTERDARFLYTDVLSSGRRERSSLAFSDYMCVRRRHLLAGLSEAEAADLTVALDSIDVVWRSATGDCHGDMAADMFGYQSEWSLAHRLSGQVEVGTVRAVEIPLEGASPSLASVRRKTSATMTHRPLCVRKIHIPSTASLCAALMRQFPQGTVKYGQRVCTVDWSSFSSSSIRHGGATKVRLICESEAVYSARHVIMAVPLGHLKKFAGKMFQPSLSDNKLAAIDRMGVGIMSKLLLYYETPVWIAPVYFVWTGRMPGEKGYDQTSLSSHCLQVSTSPSSLHVVKVSILGDLPSRAASDDAHVAEEISRILSLAPGCKTDKHAAGVQPPDRIVRSSWSQDPLFLGSHPYLRRGCYSTDPSLLARPVTFRNWPVIQFAGDYTWPEYGRLVHAARSSGLREAKRLANFYNDYYSYDNINPSCSEKYKSFP